MVRKMAPTRILSVEESGEDHMAQMQLAWQGGGNQHFEAHGQSHYKDDKPVTEPYRK